MKVLNLQCGLGHCFEGWFASESDFVLQCQNALMQCPACGNTDVIKKLSAPRLNLKGNRSTQGADLDSSSDSVQVVEPDLTAAWLALGRQIIANTTDVGSRFADEARKMHYQEVDDRAIRGTTTAQEALSLVQEGIEVVPFVMPHALRSALH
jgi:hypothetical protein